MQLALPVVLVFLFCFYYWALSFNSTELLSFLTRAPGGWRYVSLALVFPGPTVVALGFVSILHVFSTRTNSAIVAIESSLFFSLQLHHSTLRAWERLSLPRFASTQPVRCIRPRNSLYQICLRVWTKQVSCYYLFLFVFFFKLLQFFSQIRRPPGFRFGSLTSWRDSGFSVLL